MQCYFRPEECSGHCLCTLTLDHRGTHLIAHKCSVPTYPVPKSSVRFVAEVAALDTVFLLRPLDESYNAFSEYFRTLNGLGHDMYAYWWPLPWEAEHEPGEEDFVTHEQWDSMYACAKAVGLPDGEPVMVDVTW